LLTEKKEHETVSRSLNLTLELRTDIKDAADAVGMSSAAFLRLAARRAADQVLVTGCSADEILKSEKNAQLPRWMREIRDILNSIGEEGSPEKMDYSGR
jgi:coenzyme F420-reducing hydrogenase delta subunit